ncbi:MAG: hypothetical protein ICV60_15585 [Pyrinomonadaceae bacterium]|nr:hypothetical protein [Pyrinomonadaceae bacterium]
MNAKNGIKIVKRAEHGVEQKPEAAQKAEGKPDTARVVTRKVTAWVREFQQRRVRETGRSFESLFQRA